MKLGCCRHHLRIDLGRGGITRAVNAEHVEVAVALAAHRVVDALVELEIGHGSVAVFGGGRHTRCHDDGVGVDRFDGVVSRAQHTRICRRIGALLAPFARQIGLVPDLIGLDPTFVAVGDLRHEIGEVARVVRRIARPEGPIGVHADAHQQLQPALVRFVDDAIGAFPIKAPFPNALDVLPGEILLDPPEAGILDQVEIAIGDLRPPP